MYYLLTESLTGVAVGTLLFVLYTATSPGTKGVVFRQDDENNVQFCPMNVCRWMASPLYDKNFWTKNLLPVNYIVWLGVSVTITTIGKFCLDKLNGDDIVGNY